MQSNNPIIKYVVSMLMGAVGAVLAQHGYKLPEDMEVPLATFLTVLLPHVWEIVGEKYGRQDNPVQAAAQQQAQDAQKKAS